MGYKKFRIIAVAAAFLVVAAFFAFLINAFGRGGSGISGSGRSAGVTPETEEAPELSMEGSAEDVTEYGGLKEAGVLPLEKEDVKDNGPDKDDGSVDGWAYLDVLLSSVNKDIKIIITLRDGTIVCGVPFRAEIIKGNSVALYQDSDMDGVITASDLPGGRYTVHLMPERGFISPENDLSVNVRSDISYRKVDYIRTLIKTEDEIDSAAEDTADIEEEDDGALLNSGGIDLGNGTIGIDVSKYNKNIDWEKVKASGIEYAVIRLGYRGSGTGALVEDPFFKQNFEGAKAAGIKTGIYFFTQAVNETEAVEEASMVETYVSDTDLELPVFLDVESAGGRGDLIDKDTRTANIRAFIETLEHDGYRAGLYANKTWLNKHIDAAELEQYPVWLAQYKVRRPDYQGKYDMWQYSSKGHVDGIEGYVDLNVSITM